MISTCYDAGAWAEARPTSHSTVASGEANACMLVLRHAANTSACPTTQQRTMTCGISSSHSISRTTLTNGEAS